MSKKDHERVAALIDYTKRCGLVQAQLRAIELAATIRTPAKALARATLLAERGFAALAQPFHDRYRSLVQ